MKAPGTGALFQKSAKSEFLRVTGSRYDSMADRMKRKKLPELPFTKEQFRDDILGVMEGRYDGAFLCRYCRRHFTLQEIAVDHAEPISRGGGLGLNNLDYPCMACNNRKGSLTVCEYKSLLSFLKTLHPLAQTDVLGRLEKCNKLLAGAARMQMMLKKGKQEKKPDQDLGEF